MRRVVMPAMDGVLEDAAELPPFGPFVGERPSDAVAESRAKAQLRARLFGTSSDGESGRYDLLRRVGAGGAGEVYEGWDNELKRRVAIKVLQPGFERERGASNGRARLLREAQAIAQLAHPHVVAVFDVGTSTPSMERALGAIARHSVFLVMEYVEGPTLTEWLESRHPLREVVAVFISVARGLAAAHAQGIVHRDVKPSNIMFGADGRVRLLDFGLARSGADGRDDRDSTQTLATLDDLTLSGLVMGTPAFMAPEQHRGESADTRTDQYAFGVSLWEAVYGERPFHGDDAAALFAAKTRGPVVPSRSRVPGWLEATLRRALAFAPQGRHASMDAVTARLERGLRRTLQRRLILVVGVASGLAAALGAWGRGTQLRQGCDDVQAAWNDTTKVATHDAFVASGHTRAEQTWSRVDGELVAYAGGLAESRERTCADDEPNPAALACVEERTERLRALVEVLVAADSVTVDRAAEIVADLPAIDGCAQPSAQARIGSSDVARRRALMRAEAALVAGKPGEAERIAASLEAESVDAGDSAGLARARLLLGRVLLDRADTPPGAAEAQFHAALVAAETAGDDITAISALAMLVHSVGSVAGRFPEADRFLEQAHAKLTRSGTAGEAAAELLVQEGLLRYREFRNADALAAYRDALALREEIVGPEHPKVARVRVEIGNILLREGNADGAQVEFEAALTALERKWGVEHDSLTGPLNGLALVDQARGDHASALARLQRTLALAHANHGVVHDSTAVAQSNLGLTFSVLERHADALAAFDAAIAVRVALLGPRHIAVARTRANRAATLSQLGRRVEAIAELREALDVVTDELGAEHTLVGAMLVNLGEALLEAGDATAAVEALARATAVLTNNEDVHAGAAAKAFAALGVAEIVAGRPDAGREHIRTALALDAPDDVRAELRADVAIWLQPYDAALANELVADAAARPRG